MHWFLFSVLQEGGTYFYKIRKIFNLSNYVKFEFIKIIITLHFSLINLGEFTVYLFMNWFNSDVL